MKNLLGFICTDKNMNLHLIAGTKNLGVDMHSLCGISKNSLKLLNPDSDPFILSDFINPNPPLDINEICNKCLMKLRD